MSQCWPRYLPPSSVTKPQWVNTLRPRQTGRQFADDICKCIFLNGNIWTPTKISLKFAHTGPINNTLALVQIMAWRRTGDKPLSEPMLVSLPTHELTLWVQGSILWRISPSRFNFLENLFHSHPNSNKWSIQNFAHGTAAVEICANNLITEIPIFHEILHCDKNISFGQIAKKKRSF